MNRRACPAAARNACRRAARLDWLECADAIEYSSVDPAVCRPRRPGRAGGTVARRRCARGRFGPLCRGTRAGGRAPRRQCRARVGAQAVRRASQRRSARGDRRRPEGHAERPAVALPARRGARRQRAQRRGDRDLRGALAGFSRVARAAQQPGRAVRRTRRTRPRPRRARRGGARTALVLAGQREPRRHPPAAGRARLPARGAGRCSQPRGTREARADARTGLEGLARRQPPRSRAGTAGAAVPASRPSRSP